MMLPTISDKEFKLEDFTTISEIPVNYEVLNDFAFMPNTTPEIKMEDSEDWAICNVQESYNEHDVDEGKDVTTVKHELSDDEDVVILEYDSILSGNVANDIKLNNEMSCEDLSGENLYKNAEKSSFIGKVYFQEHDQETTFVKREATENAICEMNASPVVETQDVVTQTKETDHGDVKYVNSGSMEEGQLQYKDLLSEGGTLPYSEPSDTKSLSVDATSDNAESTNVELSGKISRMWTLNKDNWNLTNLAETGINIFENSTDSKEVVNSNVEIFPNIHLSTLTNCNIRTSREIPILLTDNNMPSDKPDKQSSKLSNKFRKTLRHGNNSVKKIKMALKISAKKIKEALKHGDSSVKKIKIVLHQSSSEGKKIDTSTKKGNKAFKQRSEIGDIKQSHKFNDKKCKKGKIRRNQPKSLLPNYHDNKVSVKFPDNVKKKSIKKEESENRPNILMKCMKKTLRSNVPGDDASAICFSYTFEGKVCCEYVNPRRTIESEIGQSVGDETYLSTLNYKNPSIEEKHCFHSPDIKFPETHCKEPMIKNSLKSIHENEYRPNMNFCIGQEKPCRDSLDNHLTVQSGDRRWNQSCSSRNQSSSQTKQNYFSAQRKANSTIQLSNSISDAKRSCNSLQHSISLVEQTSVSNPQDESLQSYNTKQISSAAKPSCNLPHSSSTVEQSSVSDPQDIHATKKIVDLRVSTASLGSDQMEQNKFSNQQGINLAIQSNNANYQSGSVAKQSCNSIQTSFNPTVEQTSILIPQDSPRSSSSVEHTNISIPQYSSMQRPDPFNQMSSVTKPFCNSSHSSISVEQTSVSIPQYSSMQSSDPFNQMSSVIKRSCNSPHRSSSVEQSSVSIPQYLSMQSSGPINQISSVIKQSCNSPHSSSSVEQSSVSISQYSSMQSSGPFIQMSSVIKRSCNSPHRSSSVEQTSVSIPQYSSMQSSDPINKTSSVIKRFCNSPHSSSSVEQTSVSIPQYSSTQINNAKNQNISGAKRLSNPRNKPKKAVPQASHLTIQEKSKFENPQVVSPTLKYCYPFNQNNFSVEQSRYYVSQDNHSQLQNYDPYKQSSNLLNQSINQKKHSSFSVQQDGNSAAQGADSYNQSSCAPKQFGSDTKNCNSWKETYLPLLNNLAPPIINGQSSIMHNQGRTYLATNYREIEKGRSIPENSQQHLQNNEAPAIFRQQMLCKPINDSVNNTEIEINECVESWKHRYSWLLYEDRIFSCEICKSSPIFKIENIEQKFCVSDKLCAHEWSINHKVCFLKNNKKILILIIKFLKTNLFQYYSKKILFTALAKFLNDNQEIKITEQSLPVMIEAASSLLEEIQFANLKFLSKGGFSIIVDQCRRLLIVRATNSIGHIEEFLVPKFLDKRSSLVDIVKSFSANIVYRRNVYCENCKICQKSASISQSVSSPGNDYLNHLPIRYPSFQNLLHIVENDQVVQEYMNFILMTINQNADLNFLKQSHWSDIRFINYLKEYNIQLSNKYLYMVSVLQMLQLFCSVFTKKCLLKPDIFRINILLGQLKHILSELTLNYCNLLLIELQKRCYCNGLTNLEPIELLFKSELLANVSNNPSAIRPVLDQMFYCLKGKFPTESSASMLDHLCALANFVRYQMPPFKFSTLNLITKFHEDQLFREQFKVVYGFYKILGLLPCIGAYRDICLVSASLTFSTLVNLFKRPLAIQIMQIRNVSENCILKLQ